MNLKKFIMGTILETPAKTLRDALVPKPKQHSAAGLRLLAYATHPSTEQELDSIFFFTTHKCASTYMKRLLAEIGRTGPRTYFNYPGAIWGLGDALSGSDPYFHLSSGSNNLFFPRGEIYGPLRQPIEFEQLDSYRIIFFLRDPRDVVVSAYYSFGYAHPEPVNSQTNKNFREERKKIQEEGIDQYALRAATDWLAPIYFEYGNLRRSAGESLCILYDEYIAHTCETIERIFAFCDTPIDASRLQELSDKASPIRETVASDNLTRHKRSGRSGQFKTELKTETIDKLNEIFADALSTWKFEE